MVGFKKKDGDKHPDILFADNSKSIYNYSSECRLFICTYNATTYIDSLSSNYPTIIFWNPQRWESKPEAHQYFELLRRCGIFHTSPSDAAKHIVTIWDDVPTWWNSEEVQYARIQFCNAFSKSYPDIAYRAKCILTQASNPTSSFS